MAARNRFTEAAATSIPEKLRYAMLFDWSIKLYLAPVSYILDDIYYILHPPV